MCQPTDVTATERRIKCAATSSHFLRDCNFEFRFFAPRTCQLTPRLLLGAKEASEWNNYDAHQRQRQCLGPVPFHRRVPCQYPSTRSYTNTRICDGLRHAYRVWALNRGVNTGTDGKAEEDDDVDGRHSFFVSFLPSHFLPLSSLPPPSLLPLCSLIGPLSCAPNLGSRSAVAPPSSTRSGRSPSTIICQQPYQRSFWLGSRRQDKCVCFEEDENLKEEDG
jgi:hypothetical protein